MAWMQTDYSNHMHFRWKIKWRLKHLDALGIMSEIATLYGLAGTRINGMLVLVRTSVDQHLCWRNELLLCQRASARNVSSPTINLHGV